MGGNNGMEQTQQTTSEPWSKVQPFILDFLNKAQGQTNAVFGGGGPKYFPTSTVTPFSGQTNQALTGMENIAKGGNPLLSQGQGLLGGVMQNQGVSDDMKWASNPLGQIASGQNQITTGGQYGGLFNQSQQPSQAQQNLGGLAANGVNFNTGVASGLASGQNQISTGGLYDSFLNQTKQPSMSQQAGSGYAMNGVGAGKIGAGGFQGELNRMQGPGAAERYLQGTAQGDFLKEGNPYSQQVEEDVVGRTLNSLKSTYSGAGRYGSGAMNEDLVRSVGAVRAKALSDNYEAERARQLQATGMMEAAQQGRSGIRSGLLGQMAGVEGANIDNQFRDVAARLGAAGQIDNANQGLMGMGLSALAGRTGVEGANIQNQMAGEGALNQGLLNNANLRMGASGQIDDTAAQRMGIGMNALAGQTGVQGTNIANQGNASQYLSGMYGQGMDRSLGAVDQIGGLSDQRYGDMERLAQVGAAREGLSQAQLDDETARWDYGQNAPFNALERYAAMVQGGNTGGTDTTYQPKTGFGMKALGAGASIAGILGSLAPLFALSDARAKKDIKRVGLLDTGQPVYTYKYKFGGPTTMGVMAQESPREAVARTPSGLLAVNYAKVA